jgi:hypothetical protein
LTNSCKSSIIKKKRKGELKMKNFIITVKKECTFEIEAENEELACDKAEEMFNKAEATYYIESEEEV